MPRKRAGRTYNARLGKLCKKGQAARDAVSAALEKIRAEQAKQESKPNA